MPFEQCSSRFDTPISQTVYLANSIGSGLQKLEGWTKVKRQWHGTDNQIETTRVARITMEKIPNWGTFC